MYLKECAKVEKRNGNQRKKEEEGTTGIGEGIAIPHCKSDAVTAPGLAAMVVPQGVEYDALDGEPVHIIFLIAAPNTEENVHLDVLSRLSVLLMDEQFTKDLMKAKSPEEFLHVIDVAEADKEEKEEFVKIINKNSDLLLRLITDILDFSKIESGVLDYSLSDTSLKDIFHEQFQVHAMKMPEKVSLICDFDALPDIFVHTDPKRVTQVLSNLISNAVKFTEVGSIRFSYRIVEKYVLVEVIDTGIGISPQHQQAIFDRFVKVNSFKQGTGLGLTICKTIIERLGGNISVTSEVGKGTTFTFVLPLESTSKTEAEKKEEDNQETTAETHSTEQRGKNAAPGDSPKNEEVGALPTPPSKTILIAEDTESNFILINAILGRLYRLKHAKDGMEAVTMFEEVHPDLILMDMKMPNLGGIDATRIIRELVPDVPIIALTAYAYEHDKQAALEAGCNDFLTKPFTQEVLKETIKKWLDDKG